MKENWIEIELGRVLKTTSGGTPSRRKPEYYDGQIPWVKSGELNYNLILDTEEHISEEAVKKSSAKIFPKGTLLIALYGATIGKLAFLGTDATTNQAVCGIYKSKILETKFLYYYLFHNRRKLIEKGTGGAQPNISQTILKQLPLVVTNLPIQRTIVAKIEQLFSELDNGIQNLQQAKEKLAVFRQAVLKKAFEGELTKEWRKKNKSSCSEKWSISSFGEICDFKGGGTPSKKNTDYWNGDLPWASIKDIKGDYLVKTQDKITELGYENSSANIAEAGEIIIGTRINPGRPIFSKIRTAINQDLKVVKPKIDLNTTFLFYLFKEKENDILKVSSGTTVLGINLNNLREIEIHIPNSVEEQHQIVQEIESRLSVCDEMEKSIESSLKKAEALRQSILKKAFSGELLTEKEIAQCKKEPDWETAEELLERIEKENNKTKE